MKKDYEITFAKIIIISILVFVALFYGNRYEINYLYVILAESSLYVLYLKTKMDEGQETITGLIVSTCAILVSVLCSQTRMNLPLVILTFVGCLLCDAIILFTEYSRLRNRIYPVLVLGVIFVSNIKSDSYINMGIAASVTLIVLVYGAYIYRAVIQERIQTKKEELINVRKKQKDDE